MDGLLIRPIREGDLDDIAGIAENTWDGGDYLGSMAPEWMNEPGFYGGELDGSIVGTFRMTPMPRGVLWLEGLRVHPEFRGRGLGRLLADSALSIGDRIITDGRARSMEFSTYIFNTESLAIADSQGFKVVNGFTLLYRDAPFPAMDIENMKLSPHIIPDRGGHIPYGWKFPRFCDDGLRWVLERSEQFVSGSAAIMRMPGSPAYMPLSGSEEHPLDFVRGVEANASLLGIEYAEMVLHSSLKRLIGEAMDRGWGLWEEIEGESNVLVLSRIP